MGTFGVKIKDSDLAIDFYYDIMDLYESGAGIETIRKKPASAKTKSRTKKK